MHRNCQYYNQDMRRLQTHGKPVNTFPDHKVYNQILLMHQYLSDIFHIHIPCRYLHFEVKNFLPGKTDTNRQKIHRLLWNKSQQNMKDNLTGFCFLDVINTSPNHNYRILVRC